MISSGQRLLGLDIGKKTIGLALSDLGLKIASPLKILRRSKFTSDSTTLLSLIAAESIGGLVIGWPLNMDGSEQNLSKAVKVFERNLKERYKLDVYLVDERLTSYEAKKQLGKKEQDKTLVDSTSAKIVLEQWLLERNVNE